jgi:hypothetical protein
MINVFWTEFDEFHDKNGIYENREYIFKNHADLVNNKVFIWHKKETLHYTKIFGAFACRVCSKILGIGSAERSWGDVKHLKVNKRAHLSGERVKKQATIFGTSCIELARYQRTLYLKDASSTPLKVWTDDDFKTKADLETGKLKTKTKRIFKAYLEDWEQEAMENRDLVNETKLLKKYGGLTWMDPDHNNVILYSDKKALHWNHVKYHKDKNRKKDKNHKKRYKDGGYSVRAIGPHYDENDPDNEKKNVEPWSICDILIGEIAHYYRQHPNEDVVVVEKEIQNSANGSDDKDGDDNDGDDDNKSKSDGSETASN